MHCLLIHQAFAGPDDPGGTRHYELATRLARDGHTFTIIPSTLSYLTGAQRKGAEEIGPPEAPHAVKVRPAWTPAVLHRSFVWRIIAFLTFMCTSVLRGLRVPNADVVIGTSPPIFQAVSAWLIAALRRKPFLLEVRDLWPEFAIDMGVLRNQAVISASRWLEGFLYRRARHIVVNSPAYRGYLLERGVPAGKVTVIPNGVDVSMFEPDADGGRFRQEHGLADGTFVVTYAGALGMANDIPTILSAAGIVAGSRDDTVFLLVGDGKERPRLERMSRELGLSNVVFTGSVAKRRMPEVLAASNACVATLMDIPMFRTTYPNKVFDYMAAGRPTVLGIGGVIQEVIESANGGICVKPGDPQALADAVLYLADHPEEARHMGASARDHVASNFNRTEQARQFSGLLEQAAAHR